LTVLESASTELFSPVVLTFRTSVAAYAPPGVVVGGCRSGGVGVGGDAEQAQELLLQRGQLGWEGLDVLVVVVGQVVARECGEQL
jgi:ubiquinone biosynthesis protein UbiJ